MTTDRSNYTCVRSSIHTLNNGAKVTFRLFVHNNHSDCFFKLSSSTGWKFRSQKFDTIIDLSKQFALMMDEDFLPLVIHESIIFLDAFELMEKYAEICHQHTKRLGETIMPFGTYQGRCLNKVPARWLLWYRNQVIAGNSRKPYPHIIAYIEANLADIKEEADNA